MANCARMSTVAAALYMGNMMHTRWGVRGVFGRNRAFDGLPGNIFNGKVILVTGGTGGIGRAAARQLVRMGAEVHIVGRNAEKGTAAVEEMNASTGCSMAHFHRVDLSKLNDTCVFAQQFQSEVLGPNKRLFALINNAAVMPPSHSMAEEDGGHELALSTNLLSWYILSKTLAPSLEKEGRLINVVSAGMKLYKLYPDEIEDLDHLEPSRYDGIKAYSITHRARVLLTQSWAKQTDAPIMASVHPGWVDTPGLSSAKQMRGFYKTMKNMLRTDDECADTIVWLASIPSSDIKSGAYYRDRKVRAVDFAFAGTRATAREVDALQSLVEKLTSKFLP